MRGGRRERPAYVSHSWTLFITSVAIFIVTYIGTASLHRCICTCCCIRCCCNASPPFCCCGCDACAVAALAGGLTGNVAWVCNVLGFEDQHQAMEHLFRNTGYAESSNSVGLPWRRRGVAGSHDAFVCAVG